MNRFKIINWPSNILYDCMAGGIISPVELLIHSLFKKVIIDYSITQIY